MSGYGIDLDLYAELKALGEEEVPCEDPHHEDDGDKGPGEWYVKIHCPACGFVAKGLYLLCDDFVGDAMSGALYTCQSCKSKDISGRSMFTVMGKR